MEFVIRFVCAFVVFGLVLALVALSYIDDYGLGLVAVVWGVANLGASWFAAAHGDSAWHAFFTWWH